MTLRHQDRTNKVAKELVLVTSLSVPIYRYILYPGMNDFCPNFFLALVCYYLLGCCFFLTFSLDTKNYTSQRNSHKDGQHHLTWPNVETSSVGFASILLNAFTIGIASQSITVSIYIPIYEYLWLHMNNFLKAKFWSWEFGYTFGWSFLKKSKYLRIMGVVVHHTGRTLGTGFLLDLLAATCLSANPLSLPS